MVESIKRIRQKRIGKYWVIMLVETIPNKLYLFKYYDLRNNLVYEDKMQMSADGVLEIYKNTKKVKDIQEEIPFINSRAMKPREKFPIK
jgi:hypothetical protein